MPCVVGGGLFSRPKPSSTCNGESTSAARRIAASLPSPASDSLPPPPSLPRLVMRRSISTNRPDSGRFDQSELAVTWKKIELAVAALGGRDQRRAVLQARPHLDVGPEPGRIGQHLLRDQHLGRRRQAGEQALVAERRERLRRRPRQRAAERAPAEPQRARAAGRRRPSRGAGRRSARARRPSSPTRATRSLMSCGSVPMSASIITDTLRLMSASMAAGRLASSLLAISVNGRQRALDVVERRQQRLRLLARLAREQADAVPLRARIEQMHRACRALARDLDAGHLVPELQRQVEAGQRARLAGVERERRLAQPLAARGHGVQHADARCRPRPAAPALRGGRRWRRRRWRPAPPGPGRVSTTAKPAAGECREPVGEGARVARRGRCRRRARRRVASPAPPSAPRDRLRRGRAVRRERLRLHGGRGGAGRGRRLDLRG